MSNQATATKEAQVYEHLAESLKRDLRDYWIDKRTNTVFLHEQLEQLGWAFDALSSIGHSDFHSLNRAISYYLMHSPADKYEKASVIQAMEAATKTALKLSLHSSEIGYWNWTINKITNRLSEISSNDEA